MNPARKEHESMGMYAQTIPMDFIPEIPSGGMIIFPSWVEHFVMSGNEGSTISGNIYLVDPPMDHNRRPCVTSGRAAVL